MTQLPQPQLADVRRLATADSATRGFAVDFRDLERSQAATVIDARGFVDEAGAMGAVGKAVSNVAQGIQEITLAMNASVNRRKIDEVDAQIRSAEMDLSMKLAKEKDPRKWQQMFIEEHGAWNKTLLADKTLSPDAREAIESKLNAWRMTGERDVVRKAYDRGLQLEAEGLEADRITFAANKDWKRSYEAIDAAESRGLISQDTAARQRAHTQGMVDAAAKEARANEVVTIARTQGKDAAEAYAKQSGAEPVEVERLLSDVAQIHRDEVGKVGDAFEEAVYSGLLRVPGEVDKWMAGDPRISARMREQFKGYVAAKNDDVRKQNIIAQAPELSSRYLSEVKALDPETATDEDFNALRLKIKELPKGAGEIPYLRLMSKFRKSDDPTPGVWEVVEDELESYLTAGLFEGADDPSVIPLSSDGAISTDDLKGQSKEIEKRRIMAASRAKGRKAKIGGDVRKWLNANPSVTVDDALKYMRGKLPEGTLAATFEVLDTPTQEEIDAQNKAGKGKVIGKPESSATSTPEGNQPGLPTTPGPLSNILIPQSYQLPQ